MPDTPDHRIAMHQLATGRLGAGLPSWKHKLRIADIWRDPSLAFEQRRDIIVTRIRASQWFKDYDEFGDLPMAVQELSESASPDEFNAVWDCIYDIADYDRVWIER